MRYAVIILAIGGWLAERARAAEEGPMLPNTLSGSTYEGVPTMPSAGQPVIVDQGPSAGPVDGDPGCECESHGLRGCLRQVGAWLTHRPLRTSDRYGCCRAKPLVYLPPLYYFWLDRCSCGSCGGYPGVAGYPGAVAEAP